MFRYLAYIILIPALVLTAACGNQPGELNVDLGREFTLGFGQTVSISGEPVKIKFLEMVGDSRCPKNVVCIWAGEVTCILEITYNESINRKTLVKSGASSEYVSTDFQEYEIRFDVQPYPEAGKEIKNEDYQLKLIVNKR